MLRHTLFVNSMPLAPGTQARESLDLQECFNKALETVAALKTADKMSYYTYSDLRCLRAACYLKEV